MLLITFHFQRGKSWSALPEFYLIGASGLQQRKERSAVANTQTTNESASRLQTQEWDLDCIISLSQTNSPPVFLLCITLYLIWTWKLQPKAKQRKTFNGEKRKVDCVDKNCEQRYKGCWATSSITTLTRITPGIHIFKMSLGYNNKPDTVAA